MIRQRMSKQNIVLTGFMGTGKTTVGKLLAQRLGYQFIDTDDLIEARDGRTIPQIFQQSGEVAFRQLEVAVAAELGERNRLVVSTGGGLMLDAANAVALGQRGQIYCLVATPAEIVARLLGDGVQERPLLAGPNPGQRIREILSARAAVYGQFTQIETTGKQPPQIVEELLIQIGQ